MSVILVHLAAWYTRLRRDVPLSVRRLLRYAWLPVGTAGFLAFVMVVTNLGLPQVELASASDDLEPPPAPEASVVLDVNGRRIGTLHGAERRESIPLERVPTHVRRAVLAIEDHRFYEHDGVRADAIVRALFANLAERDIAQGASTITQQYVRAAYPEIGTDRTIARKVREALAARQLEDVMSKDEIFERYLNLVYFGRGAYGIQAAARAFFGVPARKLRLHEAAYLAALIRAPGRYTADPGAARARRDYVLRRMADLGWAPERQAKAAAEQPLGITRRADADVDAPYFLEFVRRLLKRSPADGGFGLTDEDILDGGLTIHTTLDLRMQRAAEDAFREVLRYRDDPEGAMVAMSTDGQIRAMIGGRDVDSIERARGFNFAVQQARGGGRAPGSTFKPFTLAAYLAQRGDPDEVYPAPSRISIEDCPMPDGSPWEPENYEGEGFGSLTVTEATALSVNTVYAQLVAEVGPDRVMQMARDAGITSPLEPVCAITLGAFGVTPLEMARAYATFSAHGERPEVIAVTKVVDRQGAVIGAHRPFSTRTMNREVADGVSQILQQVMERGTGAPARISRPAAGKTGTTEDRRDLWFAGYTPDPGLSAAVWIGHLPRRDGTIPSVRARWNRPNTGGGFAGAIWRLFMERATRGLPERDFPQVRFDIGPSFDGTDTVEIPDDPAPQPNPEPKPDPKPEPKPEPSDRPKPKETKEPEPQPSESPTEEP